MLDQAFEALKKFDFGTPLSDVQAIEDAAVAAHTDAEVRKDLEQRLIAALGTDISRAAKDYVCRKLALIGSATAVPVLASLLSSQANAHLTRHALERIPGGAASYSGIPPHQLALVAGPFRHGVDDIHPGHTCGDCVRHQTRSVAV